MLLSLRGWHITHCGWRQPQGKRHFKINICVIVTIIRVSHLVRIVQFSQHLLQLNCEELYVGVNIANLRFTVGFSRCRQNRKCGHFTLLLCVWRHIIIRKWVPHVQHDYFPHLTNEIIALWRCRCLRRCWSSLIRSLGNDEGNGNDNSRKERSDWLSEEKLSCCTCGTHLSTFLWRSLANDIVKFTNLRF